jgi:hypothetical protein
MQLYDIVSLQLYLDSSSTRSTDYELTTAFIRPNKSNPNLIHIIEKGTHKMLSFQTETLFNLVRAKQLYQFDMCRPDLMAKADDCVQILSELYSSFGIDDVSSLNANFENILEKTKSQDRIFLGELMSKFPTTFLATITY